MLKTPLNYIRSTHMLSSCLAIISTQIWHLAAPPACAGMRRRSQVNVLYYNYYSTPGQIEAHAVLHSVQKRVRNSFRVPRFCLTIMRQGEKKKGIPFYNSALVEWWTSLSLKCPANEQLCSRRLWPHNFCLWPCDMKITSPFLASLLLL